MGWHVESQPSGISHFCNVFSCDLEVQVKFYVKNAHYVEHTLSFGGLQLDISLDFDLNNAKLVVFAGGGSLAEKYKPRENNYRVLLFIGKKNDMKFGSIIAYLNYETLNYM